MLGHTTLTPELISNALIGAHATPRDRFDLCGELVKCELIEKQSKHPTLTDVKLRCVGKKSLTFKETTIPRNQISTTGMPTSENT